MAKISFGQIWREVDPRRVRHVRVENVGIKQIAIRTVINGPSGWHAVARSRISEAAIERFNGKRGGYELVSSQID